MMKLMMSGDNDDDDEDAVQQSDLIGGGPLRKHQCRNDASYKFEEERNI